MTDPLGTARALAPYAKIPGKPLLASWMGGAAVEQAVDILNRAGIPTFPFPDTAARIFNYMWRYSYNLRGLYETPTTTGNETAADTLTVETLITRARCERRTLLSEVESKQVLAAYGVATVRTEAAGSAEAAVKIADALGYPVVLKVFSRSIAHKTDVDGVRLNLCDAAGIRHAFESIRTAFSARYDAALFEGVTVQPMVLDREAYELIIGSSIDPQFGPVLLFGTGGQLVEVFHDRALALPPLNTTLAMRMMEQTKIFKALQGVRGRRPIDIHKLAEVLVAFSRLVVEQPWIKEIDINPLLVSPERVMALDARIVLHPADMPREQLPRPALRPYPTQYVDSFTMRDGQVVTIRPIRPDDEPKMVPFHQLLSDRSVYSRYFHALKLRQRVSHEQLVRSCFSNYDKELALVAERTDVSSGEREILAMAQLSRLSDPTDAEFALLIADPWQRQGLGSEMLSRLIRIGKAEGVQRISAQILPDNLEMQRLCARLGFRIDPCGEPDVVNAEIMLA